MIPLRDTIRARRFPVVNTLIIAVNVLIFLFMSLLPGGTVYNLVVRWGLVPVRFHGQFASWPWLTLFTSMFLHGGWLHIISNMLALYIFGDNVEDRMGPLGYLVFYLLSGVLAGMIHLWAYGASPMPTVGASGAIAGVLGAYLLLYPRARVVTLVPLFSFVRIIEIPVVLYLGFWFLSQLFNGVLALGGSSPFQRGGGVAWWAHIGGFVAGLLLVKVFARKERRTYPDDIYPRYSTRWSDWR